MAPTKGKHTTFGTTVGPGVFVHPSIRVFILFLQNPSPDRCHDLTSLLSLFLSAFDHHTPASALTPTRTAKFLSISLEVPSGLSPKKPSLTNRKGSDGFPSPILFKQEASQTLQMQFSPTGEEHK